jgi:glycosyltransferase involved in cell wall biosynthesis
LKVLLISDYSTPTGGVEIYQAQLRDSLRKAGIDARLFASSVGRDDLRDADVECWGSDQRHANRLLQTFNPVALLKLREVLRQFQPDIVHLNLFLTQLSPSVLLLLKNIPVVYTAHMYRMICPLGQKLLPDGKVCRVRPGRVCLNQGCLTPGQWALDMTQRAILLRFLRNINAIWANSECTANLLRESGIPVDRVQNCFLTTPYRDIAFPIGPPAVGFVGRLVPEKGVSVLLQAFRKVRERLPDARLLIAGDGKEKAHLKSLCSTLGLEPFVDFWGYLPSERLPELWSQIQVQVVPSLWAEPFGLVATEAMAAARPVIASRGGGLEESVMDGETGLLFEPGNVDELTDGLLKLLNNYDLCRKMGKRGLATCLHKLDNTRILKEHLDGYQALRSDLEGSGHK